MANQDTELTVTLQENEQLRALIKNLVLEHKDTNCPNIHWKHCTICEEAKKLLDRSEYATPLETILNHPAYCPIYDGYACSCGKKP